MTQATGAAMTLEWKDSYQLGYPSLDAEHELAFKLLNQFIAAQDQAEQTVAAMQLYQHTRLHFAHEEALMRERNFPDAKAHTERHNVLIGRMNVICISIAQGEVNKQALLALMTDWAMCHIAQDDAQFAAFEAAR